MNQFTAGFGNELIKVAVGLGLLKGLGKTVIKHPLLTLGAGGTLLASGMGASQAYKEGLRGGEKPRYLEAGVDPISGQATTSDAAYTNFNPLFRGKTPKKDVEALSKHYDEKKFKR